MNEEQMATDKYFKIKFEGENEIDANTLITSLIGLSSTIQEIQKKISPDSKKVKIKIKAFEQGSFLIFLGIHAPEILDKIRDMFTKDNIILTSALLTILMNSINIKKHLQGEPAKEIEKDKDGQNISITNQDGQIIIVNTENYNLYNSTPEIEKGLTKTFQAIESDENIKGVSFTDEKEKPLLEIKQEEIQKMTILNESVSDVGRVLLKENAPLSITKINFAPNLKWAFLNEGMRISAHITDENFYHRIDQGERFAKGDTLIVDLKMNQEYSALQGGYINKSYEVIKVIEHIERPEQLGLDL